MNKVLLIIFILVIGFVNKSYSKESCDKFINFSWRYENTLGTHVKKDNAYYAKFSFKSTSSDEIKITRLYLLTSDGKTVREKTTNLYIKPFGKKSEIFYTNDINLDVVQSASYNCQYQAEPVAPPLFSEPKKKNNLIDNTSNDYLQYWWVVVLLAVGIFFVYMTTTKDLPKIKRKVIISNSNNTLFSFFWGEQSLIISYWGFYTVGSIVGALIISFAETSKVSNEVIVLIALIVLIYTAYAMIGTWRSAENYKIEKRKKKEGVGWAITAQVLIVLAVIRIVVEFVKALSA